MIGVSAYFHDSAAALVVDGDVVAAAQEERFSRRKGDAQLPVRSVEHCLQAGGLKPSEVDVVAYYESPQAKFHRLLNTYRRIGPPGWESAKEALPRWASHRLNICDDVCERLGVDCPVMSVRHHESHAASAFFPSPFGSAAIVVMDAVGEWATSSIGHARGSLVELDVETRFPHSLGLLYSAFTAYLGFKVNSGEYKVMGLAPYGQPRFVDRILGEIIDVDADGSITMEQSFFEYQRGRGMVSDRFASHFGRPPREPETPLDAWHMDVAASIQEVCEIAALRTARHARRITGERRLVMAGGVALNCVANGRIRREAGFDDVWVQPAAGDAGGALGAGLLAWHRTHPRRRVVRRPDSQRGSALGPAFDDADIGLFLDGAGANYERMEEEVELLAAVSELLQQGATVGWFHGGMEFGPRALGNRSILADPRRPDAQRIVNQKIKFRESFRPFAPSVLREHAHELFDVGTDYDSPYMLFVEHVRESERHTLTSADVERLAHHDLHVRLSVPRSSIPAVTHIDYSARVQTVDAERHGRFHRLLAAFHERTGCPVLLNTSFNVRGEPIVQNPDDAYRCFLATDLDALVMENHLLHKDRQPPAAVADAVAQRPTSLD